MDAIEPMSRFVLGSWIVLASSLALAVEETPLALKVTSPSEVCAILTSPGSQDGPPLPMVVPLDRNAVRDPTSLDPLLACGAGSRLQPVVLLEPPVDWQNAPDPYEALSGWLRDLEGLLLPLGDRVHVFQLGHRPDLSFSPRAYAFLVEKVGTLLHSIDPEVTLVLGALGEGSQTWLDQLDLGSLTPYVEAIALQDPIDLEVWSARLARDHPAMRLWLHADPSRDPGAFIARFHQARIAGVQTMVAPSAAESGGAALSAILLHLIHRLPARFVASPDRAEAAAGGAAPLLRFEDPLSPEKALVVLDPLLTALDVGPDPVVRVRAFDLAAGTDLVARSRSPESTAGPSVIDLPERTGPALILFIAMRGPRGSEETVAVTSERELTVEEIIAGERVFQAAQERALDHYQADATISYHYRAETLGQAIDVVSVNRFYWKEGTGDYEEIELLINGARWRGAAPALPFIQAEKVKEVPLEIRLDQSYEYRLKGKETIDGRQAYVVAFEPVAGAASLYSGAIWIEAGSFARLRLRLVQHGLKEPITSNTDVIEYAPVAPASPEPDSGTCCRLPVRAYRQMVFTVVGRAVVAERLVTYENFSINSDAFEPGLQRAYDSGHPILRDDASGYSWLVKEGDGPRRRVVDSPVNVAFFAGFGIDSDRSLGTPFAGMNYFNFNWRNTGTQMDIAFAGVLGNVVWTDPALGSSRWELTLDGRFVAIGESFHRTVDSGRIEAQDVETLQEQALVTLSHPLTPFQRVVFQAEMDYDHYGRDSDTDPNFDVPASGFSGIGTARWNYNRKGYQLDLWHSAGHRFSWDDWGIDDPNGPPGVSSGGAGDETEYRRYGLNAFKSFYPGKTQSIGLGLSFFDGESLDRFSRFRIGDFRNARVRGFSSKDLTFDRGVTAQITCQFALAGTAAGIELGLDAALIENEEDFDGRASLFGGGGAVSFNGPWGTLMTLRTHFALGSSLDFDTSGASLRILMIKTLDHWPRRKARDQ